MCTWIFAVLVISGYHSVPAIVCSFQEHGTEQQITASVRTREPRCPRVSVTQPLIRETVLIQINSDSSAQWELLHREFAMEMLRPAPGRWQGSAGPAAEGPALAAPAARPPEEFHLS